MLADIGLAAVALAAIALATYLAYSTVSAKSAERDALVREANQIGNQKIAAMQVDAANASVAQMKTALDAANQKIAILAKGSSDADVVPPGSGDSSLRGLSPAAPAPSSASLPSGGPAAGASGQGPG